MLTVYGIANCDTIKKTKKWLESNSIDFSFHDYKKLGCDAALTLILLTGVTLMKMDTFGDA